ncbi:uncharacterized protein LOC110464610 [Mizuhopecten yessoensis]|uniref:uncharacterized protein LOC110464610 n=1 Tax=Mizuhopecten yessoensis TaxID=6573 RepID=UPI000B45B4BF|nr:uncharacterized protein LOC110464610 [Mizuhopecten yessoensis]
MINHCFDRSEFPCRFKEAQDVPVFKKKNILDTQNYQPVSILPCTSKTFERTMCDQLTAFFSNAFHPFLAAFRLGFGCQSTLLRLVEDWCRALDNHEFVAALLMDHSKAFDCLPHNLLVGKLEAYGLSKASVNLVSSYQSSRKQQAPNEVLGWKC